MRKKWWQSPWIRNPPFCSCNHHFFFTDQLLHRQKESHVLSSPPPSPLLSSPMQLKRNPHATKTPRPLHKSQQHKQNQSPTPFLPDYKAKHQGFLWHPKTQTHTHTHTHTHTNKTKTNTTATTKSCRKRKQMVRGYEEALFFSRVVVAVVCMLWGYCDCCCGVEEKQQRCEHGCYCWNPRTRKLSLSLPLCVWMCVCMSFSIYKVNTKRHTRGNTRSCALGTNTNKYWTLTDHQITRGICPTDFRLWFLAGHLFSKPSPPPPQPPPRFLFWLTFYSQKALMEFFLMRKWSAFQKNSLAIIRSNFKKNRHIWFKNLAKNIRRMSLRFLLSYLACNQIWLNIIVDHCHFDYINTKFTQNKDSLFHSPYYCTWFMYVAKNIRRIFFKILLSYLACNQIWLNIIVDHCHFDYITQNWPQKKRLSFPLSILLYMVHISNQKY